MEMQVDFLIIGQGLAGSMLAQGLRARGKTVRVVDDGWKSSASQVAAGLMTPLTGRRFTLTKDYPQLFATARQALTAAEVFRPMDVYRMFVDEEQRTKGLKRAECGSCQPFIRKITQHQGEVAASLTDTFGGAMMQGAWVDLPKLLADVRAELTAAGCMIEDIFEPEEMRDHPAGIAWKGVRAGGVIFCDGYKSALRGPFKDLAWQPAKGEALNITSNAPQGAFILNREGWVLPLGGGRWRTGTNWQWDQLDEAPTEAQKAKLIARFQGYFAHPVGVDVTAHVAGVRPCTADNHPFLGTHPTRPRVHILNGLGPRGTVWAPTAVNEMVAYLVDGHPIRPECDVRRKLSRAVG